jgi:hypothetical protein
VGWLLKCPQEQAHVDHKKTERYPDLTTFTMYYAWQSNLFYFVSLVGAAQVHLWRSLRALCVPDVHKARMEVCESHGVKPWSLVNRYFRVLPGNVIVISGFRI